MKNKQTLTYLTLTLLTSSLVQAGEVSLEEKDSDVQFNLSSSSNTTANTLPDWVTQNMAPFGRIYTNNFVNELSEEDKLKAELVTKKIINNNMNAVEVISIIKTAIKINFPDLNNCLEFTKQLSKNSVKYEALNTFKLASLIPENVRTEENYQSAAKLFSHTATQRQNISALHCLEKVDENQRLDTLFKSIALFELNKDTERNLDILQAMVKVGIGHRKALFDKLSELLNDGPSKDAIDNLTKAILFFPENVINESLEALLQDSAVDLESENKAMLFLFKNDTSIEKDIVAYWQTQLSDNNYTTDYVKNNNLNVYLSNFILNNAQTLNLKEGSVIMQQARMVQESSTN